MSITIFEPMNWTTSTASAGGMCVEVKITETEVLVRHSRREHEFLRFTHPEWDAFIQCPAEFGRRVGG